MVAVSDILISRNSESEGSEHPETIYIDEAGFYSLVLGSRLPSAQQFKLKDERIHLRRRRWSKNCSEKILCSERKSLRSAD
jgi:hypothetical protein